MCIRDSYKNHPYFEGAEKSTMPALAEWVMNSDKVVSFWNCLLYTSDAADDLLCVDLGGRRIIKKKN